MFAVRAGSSTRFEERVAPMAGSARSLLCIQILQILASPASSDTKELLFWVRIDSKCLVRPFLVLLLDFLDTLDWIARAFLASLVLAVVANLIRTVGCLATMACAFDPHTNFLLNPLSVACHGPSPLVRAQGQTILGE